LNYVNKKYVTADETKAIRDLAETIPFGGDIEKVIEEFNRAETREAQLANDADQLELILMLKECKDLATSMLMNGFLCLKRLRTEKAQALARAIIDTDSTSWWFKDKVTGGLMAAIRA